MKNIRLTTFEVVSTLSIIGLGPILLSYPQNAAKEFGSAAVFHYLYITALIFLLATILYKLYKPFEGKNIFDISNFLGGKTLESIFGTLLATYLLILSVSTIHEFGQDIKNMMFPNSLVSEINLFLTIGILLGIYTGIRGLFRTGRNNFFTTVNWFGINVCSFILQNGLYKFNSYFWPWI